VVAVLLGVLVTGAFHEDGLADTADAFAGGWTREARLRILDDPLHGSYGVAALCGSIVLRVVAVAALGGHGPAVVFGAIVAAHALSRAAAVAAMGTVRVAKEEGLGADYARSVGGGRAVAGVVGGTAIAVVAVGWWAGPMLAGAAVAAASVSWLAVRKIGGISGDVLGAVEQVAECATLVVATGLATRYGVWWS
jgi:adenosylcobinamide-GDP ribazoletransferase